MTPEEFAASLFNQIVVDNAITYQAELEKAAEDVNNDQFRELVKCYHSMNPDAKKAIVQLLNIASVNAVSEILGILDGTTQLSDRMRKFSLLYEDERTPLNGYLQDYFLEIVEETDILEDN